MGKNKGVGERASFSTRRRRRDAPLYLLQQDLTTAHCVEGGVKEGGSDRREGEEIEGGCTEKTKGVKRGREEGRQEK